ncbi:MAG: cation diffusion facilitator family transporter [Elusimicrobia bacterium]|nr:cation diffusion facilitator family transporter [Elusimicrobiota bacterium]
MGTRDGSAHIFQALVSNIVIATAKGAAAFWSGSGALLAETIHTFADCGNQLLLLLGVRRSQRPPDESHPLGYGRSVYFWSFMVAIMLFLGGGAFSVYEGIEHLLHPQPVESLGMGAGVLFFALTVEAWATWSNLREIKRRRGDKPLLGYLRDTKDSDLIVVFGENAASLFGGALALAAVLAAMATGDARFDAGGSVAIGVVLLAVAVFLAVEIQSLLIGEAADPEVAEAVRRAAAADSRIRITFQLITVQEGPGTVLVALKIACPPELPARDLHELIEAFERRVREVCPAAKWLFVEPDLSS